MGVTGAGVTVFGGWFAASGRSARTHTRHGRGTEDPKEAGLNRGFPIRWVTSAPNFYTQTLSGDRSSPFHSSKCIAGINLSSHPRSNVFFMWDVAKRIEITTKCPYFSENCSLDRKCMHASEQRRRGGVPLMKATTPVAVLLMPLDSQTCAPRGQPPRQTHITFFSRSDLLHPFQVTPYPDRLYLTLLPVSCRGNAQVTSSLHIYYGPFVVPLMMHHLFVPTALRHHPIQFLTFTSSLANDDSCDRDLAFPPSRRPPHHPRCHLDRTAHLP